MMDVNTQQSTLPDVAHDVAAAMHALDWVGMQRIDLPWRLRDAHGHTMQVPASVDVQVDLRDPAARGIHMSRLYLQLQQRLCESEPSPASLRQVLQACVLSQNGLSSSARLTIRYDHMIERAALVSEHRGWRRYPIEIEASLHGDKFAVGLRFAVEYSSTCPASAALSRQLNAERFAADFVAVQPLSAQNVRDWLATERATAATPHAQRSRANIALSLHQHAGDFPVQDFVDLAETALATPVQTAVKREDEQAFAARNAENLMFCEDAARRLATAFAEDARVTHYDVQVAHYESLHAHDAVARVSGPRRT